DGDLGGELRQEDGLLHGAVAAADDDGRLLLEERRVARGAVGDAAAAELLLAGDAQLLVLGAHREDDRPGLVLVVADPDLVDAAGLLGELDPGRLVGDEAGAEALRLVAELLHHVRPHDPLGEPGVVLDVGRLLQQPAPEEALDHQRTQVRAGRVQGGRVPGRAAAHDDDVLDFFGHVCLASVQCFRCHFTLYSTPSGAGVTPARPRPRRGPDPPPALPASA